MMDDSPIPVMPAKKETKHEAILSSIRTMGNVINDFRILVYRIEGMEEKEPAPSMMEMDEPKLPHPPSLVGVLNESPKRINDMSKQLDELTRKLKEILF